jgi:hypothetical protein
MAMTFDFGSQKTRQRINSVFGFRKNVPVFDTWKMHEYLTGQGIQSNIAGLFVESYADIVRSGHSQLVNGTREKIRAKFISSGCSAQEADSAVDLLDGLLREDVAA